MTPRLLSATTLEGTNVKNRAGKDVGEIEDLMIDIESGSVAYAVLSFGGFLGIGEKLFAVPLEAFEFRNTGQVDAHIVLDIDKEKLENAPGFDKDNWPQNPDKTFITSVYGHYGVEPYWEKHSHQV